MVYQQEQGLLYVLGFVATRDQPTDLKISIPAGAATDRDGTINAATQQSLVYQPHSGVQRSAAWGGAARAAQ